MGSAVWKVSIMAGNSVGQHCCGPAMVLAKMCVSLFPVWGREMQNHLHPSHFFHPSFIPTAAKDLVSRLLVVDPKKRYTAHQVLQHPWIETAGKTGRVNLQKVVQRGPTPEPALTGYRADGIVTASVSAQPLLLLGDTEEGRSQGENSEKDLLT